MLALPAIGEVHGAWVENKPFMSRGSAERTSSYMVTAGAEKHGQLCQTTGEGALSSACGDAAGCFGVPALLADSDSLGRMEKNFFPAQRE